MSDGEHKPTDDPAASDRELGMSLRIARLKKELAQSKKDLRALLEQARRQERARRDTPGSEQPAHASGRDTPGSEQPANLARRDKPKGEQPAHASGRDTPGSEQPADLARRDKPKGEQPAASSRQGFVRALFQPRSKVSEAVTQLPEVVHEACPAALFDAEFYLKQAQALGVEGAEANPWASYVSQGERLGLNPHPLFKTQYYLQQLSWQAPNGQTLLSHYLEHGHRQDLRPHPLFAPRFYREQLPAEANCDTAVLLHYLALGYKQGLKPTPVFDPQFYLTRYPDVQAAGVEPLCHYIRCGDKEGRQPNPYFDPGFYRQYCGLLSEWETSLEHYQELGRFDGKKPNRAFDEDLYLNFNADAIDYEGGAFAHFCHIGAREGRRHTPEGIAAANPYDDEAFAVHTPAPLPEAPSARDWEELAARASTRRGGDVASLRSDGASVKPGEETSSLRSDGASVRRGGDVASLRSDGASVKPGEETSSLRSDGASVKPGQENSSRRSDRASVKSGEDISVTVIVPVYRNLLLSLACIHSVLKADTKIAYRLLVVDDCSPEPDLSAELQRLSESNLFTLIANEVNLGFVGSVNRAMAECLDQDVVLLNSDTVVFDGWLDRLVRAAGSGSKIGTVTPLSNNGTICSYPVFCADNNQQLEVDFVQLDKIISETLPGRTVSIPTAVGFCMLITRGCLNEIGKFDEEAFGKGYGEENDFCLKASARGWSHVLAADTFVRHVGSASFGAEKNEHMQRGGKVIAERYPFYEKLMDDFCKDDPLKVVRRQIDLARAMPSRWQRSILFFAHRQGGGVEKHIHDLVRCWEAHGVKAIVARPAKNPGSICEIHSLDTGRLPNLSLDLAAGWEESKRLLQELKVGHIHIHHTASYSANLCSWVEQAVENSQLPFDFTIHDYGPICPRLNFVDGSGIYCGEPDERSCQKCVDNNGTDYGQVDVVDWRRQSQKLLATMRRVIAPSNDVLKRYENRFQGLNLILKPHIDQWPDEPASFPLRQKDEPLRVALIGSLNPHKGRQVLIACAQDAWRRKLPLEFVIVGLSHDETVLSKLPNVVITGPFEDARVLDVIARHKCHASFFASVCPETYSYTLSLAMAANLFPFSFDFGAIAERLRAISWGKVLKREWIGEPSKINDELLNTRLIPLQAMPATAYPSLIADYYELPVDFLQTNWQSLYGSGESSRTAAAQEPAGASAQEPPGAAAQPQISSRS